MPLFEYECSDCHEKFEELVSFSQSNNLKCPKCGSKRTQKLVSKFATTGNSVGNGSSNCGTGNSPFR